MSSTVQKPPSPNGHQSSFMSLQLPKDKAWSGRKYSFYPLSVPCAARAQAGNVN